jgi:membrane-associated phospholipid phosphatase
MTGSQAPPQQSSLRIAGVLTEALGPVPLGMGLCIGVGAATDGISGAGWGLLAITFAAVLPYIATWRARHPAEGSLPTGPARLRYLAATIAFAAVGTAIVAAAGAPTRVVAVTGTMLLGLVVGALVNAKWRGSNHAAAAAGGATMLTILYGPWFLLAFAVAAVVAWSRVVLRRHSVGEVILGLTAGVAVSAVVLPLLV